MAVAYDNDTQSLNLVTTNTITFGHTVTGSTPSIVVFVILSGSAQSVSTITYAGAGLSQIGATNFAASIPFRIEAWGLGGCSTGANNVIVTLSANNSAWDVSAISFTGTAGTFSGYVTGNTQGGSASSITVNVTTGASGDMVVDCSGSTNNNGTTSGGGQTQQWQDNTGTTNYQGSTKAGGSGSIAMIENWDLSDLNYGLVALNVAGATTVPHVLWNNNAIRPRFFRPGNTR